MSQRLGMLPLSDDRPAIVEPGAGSLSYAALDRLADEVATRVRSFGATPGACIGLYLRRSADAVAAMLGILRAGCVYVPVDPRAPVDRVAAILDDCAVEAAFVEERFEAPCRAALDRVGRGDTSLLTLREVGCGRGIAAWAAARISPDVPVRSGRAALMDVACLLYTSGTTGRPKGWMMSRGAIEAHAGWCHQFLTPGRDDVFANHAQFSFGMSLFDIYSSLGCGARLVLVPDEVRQHGGFAADLIARERVSIWFSGPAILSLIAQLDDLESRDLSALRVVAFAGEVFPLRHLNALRRRLRHPRYFNFYGSTEANVALHYELAGSGDLEERPPIGRPCAHYEARVAGPDGAAAPPGVVGELQLRGGGLSAGYWKQPAPLDPLVAAADGRGPWFRTGDLAVEIPGGELRFAGRIGRMVKLRGYRVEPGEIEARLYQHPSIREAGVVSVETASGLELVAHVSLTDGGRLPTVALKEFCAVTLPAYMIPSRFEFHPSLPKTSSGKVDVQSLRALHEASAAS